MNPWKTKLQSVSKYLFVPLNNVVLIWHFCFPEASIAYATFVKSDDGNPDHGNVTGIYDDFADKIADAQNSTLEYQDEMKVRVMQTIPIIPFHMIHEDLFCLRA